MKTTFPSNVTILVTMREVHSYYTPVFSHGFKNTASSSDRAGPGPATWADISLHP
jgi:hypothetical protein